LIQRNVKKAVFALRSGMDRALKRSTRKIHFLHIGKNAGNQIKHLSGQLNSAQNEVKIVSYGHGRKLVDLPADAAYFFSIRNPAERFRSGFYSRKRKGRPRHNIDWSHGETIAFENFEHANDLAEALFRKDGLGEKAFWAMSDIGHVRDQQFNWFQKAGVFLHERPPIHIIRQESLESDFEFLLQLIRSELTLNDLKISEKREIAHHFDYSDSPKLSRLANSNLEMWYKRDFEFYEICVDWISKATLVEL
jgi:hypothetical protein